MLILRNGGSAVDAVEVAVKVLEDREITNAGYGSNLSMEGIVECDASIVDHHGRSGAVGAVYSELFQPLEFLLLITYPRDQEPNITCPAGSQPLISTPHSAACSAKSTRRSGGIGFCSGIGHS